MMMICPKSWFLILKHTILGGERPRVLSEVTELNPHFL